MARSTGGINFPNNFEVKKAAPLDARLWCSTLNDMYALRFTHKGMVVSVTDETDATLNGLYVMQNQIAPDVDSQLSDWKIVGTGDNSSDSFSTTSTDLHSNNEGNTLTVDTGLSYVGGEYISIAYALDLTNVQIAIVTAYSGDQLTFSHVSNNGNLLNSNGEWIINLSGTTAESINSSGVISSGQFNWSTWMGQAPGFQSGNMEYGGATEYQSATQLTFHKEDADGVDQSTFLDQYLNAKSGQIKTILDASSSHNNVYQIVGASIDNSGNYVFDVYIVSYDDFEVTTGSTKVYFVFGSDSSLTLQEVLNNSDGEITASVTEDLSISSKEMKLTGNSNNGINSNNASIEISKDGVGDITISGSNMGTPSKGDVLVSKDSDGSLEWRKLNRNYFQTLTEIDDSYVYDLDLGLNAFIYHDSASPIYIDIINLENGSSGNIIIDRSDLNATINLGSIDGRLITSSSVNHKFLGGVEFTSALETCIVSYICRIDINNIITMYWTIGNSYT